MAWAGTNGWPGNSIQVLPNQKILRRTAAFVHCLSNNNLDSFLFRAMVISLFAVRRCGPFSQISFVNTSHTELRVFGLVCNFRAAKVKRAGLIESCMSSYDLWWNRIDSEA